MKSMYVKRIGTIATGAVMFGAALSGAVGAGVGDLSQDFFYDEDMSPNVTLVVGSSAAASDGIAAANLAATIGNLAYAATPAEKMTETAECKAGTGDGATPVCEGSITLSTTSTGYTGLMDQDERCPIADKDDDFYCEGAGTIFGDNRADCYTEIYSEENTKFKEIKTHEVCEARTEQKELDVLLDEDYINNQCYLCYDICQDTVTDLEHEMYEAITVDKCKVTYYEDGLTDDDIEEKLRMAVEAEAITYSVYTDFLPPTFLKNDKSPAELIDSRYRGKMMFLGEEYYVTEWDDSEEILKLAKGKELDLNNKAFGGDFEASDGNYQFKIHRTIMAPDDQVAGIVIDVKQPDGTERQIIAKKSENARVGNIEIYAANVASGGDYVTAEVKVYDTSTEIVLEDGKYFSDDEVWDVELQQVPLKCLIAEINEDDIDDCDDLDDDDVTNYNSTLSDAAERLADYAKVDVGADDNYKGTYANEGMLVWVHLTLMVDYDGDDALFVSGEDEPHAIMFPNDAFQFSYEGYKTDKFLDLKCSGGDEGIVIEADDGHQVTISFTDDNMDRYDDVHMDNGPIEEGEKFLVGGEVYEFESYEKKKIGDKDGMEIKVRNLQTSTLSKAEFTESKNLLLNVTEFCPCESCKDDVSAVKSTTFYNGTILGIDATFATKDKALYLAANGTTLGLSSSHMGTLSAFDMEEGRLEIRIVQEGSDVNAFQSDDEKVDDDDGTGNHPRDRLDTFIEIYPYCDNCDQGAERAYIDFYDPDEDEPDEECFSNVIVVTEPDFGIPLQEYENVTCNGAPWDLCYCGDYYDPALYNSITNGTIEAVLDDEDQHDTLWLPGTGTKLVVDWEDENRFNTVEICQPTEIVHQTYFIGKGKNETKSTVTITDEQIDELIPEIGYTVDAFGVSTAGVTEGEATVVGGGGNVTAVVECPANNMPRAVGKLVVLDSQAPSSGNLVIIGGSGANSMGIEGLAAGDVKVEVSGSKLYVAGYTAAETQQAVDQVINWLKSSVDHQVGAAEEPAAEA